MNYSPIRVLHLADLHLGVENYGKIDPASGLHSRFRDYLDRLDEAIDAGIAFDAHMVLIAGDIYKSRTPNPTHQREFARRIRRITSAGLPILILTGNHDVSPAAGRAHSVEIFDTLAVDGVTIADRPQTHRLETRAGVLQVIALPWVSRHTLLSREEMRGVALSELETTLRARLAVWIEHQASALDPNVPAVLAYHGSVDGAVFGSERSVTLGSDLSLPPSALTPPGVDYVALGHIHKHQCLRQDPPMVYPGSLDRVDFGEEADDKGCVLVEVTRGAATWRFHRLAARPFTTIRVDVSAASDPLERVRVAIGRAQVQNAVVRVQIQATAAQSTRISDETIRHWLEEAGAWHVAAVALEVERSGRMRHPELEERLAQGLTPLDALKLYLESRSTAPERIAALIAAAEELLKEE